MGLQFSLKTGHGLDVPTAFAVIEKFIWSRESEGGNILSVEASIFLNQQAYSEGRKPIETKTFTTPIDDDQGRTLENSVISALYDHLKDEVFFKPALIVPE